MNNQHNNTYIKSTHQYKYMNFNIIDYINENSNN